jgi:phosphoribosylformimino-5-aminoimidazole carboxamide ribotide isomerase
MRFRPCIDLHRGKVKQIVGGTYRDRGESGLVTNFETDDDPATFAALYRSRDLPGGHVIMIGEGNEEAAVGALRAFPRGLQVGGGITPRNAGRFLDAGASHVIITSYVFKDGTVNWDNLREAVAAIGKERLVLDLSCRKRGSSYYIVTDRWQRFTHVTVDHETLSRLGEYCAEFLVHAADVEGRQEGIEEQVVRILAAHSPVPATYAGGIRSLADLDVVDAAGEGEVDATVGSALDIFGGTLKFTDVVEWHRNHAGQSADR